MRTQNCLSAPDEFLEFPTRPAFDVTHTTWLTAAEAARDLKIKTRTILFWTRSGKIKAYPLTGTKRRIGPFLQSDFDAILIHSKPVVSSAQPSVLENERRI